MKQQGSASKIKLHTYNDLVCARENGEQIISLKIQLLQDFHNHPFRVVDDLDMEELVDSIRQKGVLVPLIVRQQSSGKYEIIAGHRRKHAALAAGMEEVPAVIRDLSDEDATILMTDSNLQREHILPSEKAFAYKMKMDAMKHPGEKGNATPGEVGRSNGESGRQVQRFIRLTYLQKELLQYVDENKLAFTAAVELSYLPVNDQKIIQSVCRQSDKYPSITQAEQLHVFSSKGELTFDKTIRLMYERRPEKRTVRLNQKKINQFFSKEYEREQIEEIIYQLLEKWKKEQK